MTRPFPRSPLPFLAVAGLLLAPLGSPAVSYFQNPFGSTSGGQLSLQLNADAKKVSMRFTAKTSKSVIRLHVYLGSVNQGSSGTSYRIGLQADAAGVPSGTYLGSGTISTENVQSNNWATVTLDSSVSVTSGQTYHVVIQRDAGDTTDSNVTLQVSTPNLQLYPGDGSSDANARAIFDEAADGFANDTGDDLNPVYVVEFSDGSFEGNPVAKFVAPAANRIYNGQDAGQIITPSTKQLVSDVRLIIRKSGSPGNCVLHLEDVTSGIELDSVTVAPGSIGTSYGFITFAFTRHQQLTSGRTYRLYLTNNSGSANADYYDLLVADTGSNNATYAGLTYGGSAQAIAIRTGGSWVSNSRYDAYFRMTVYPLSGFRWAVASTPQNNKAFNNTIFLTALSSDPVGAMAGFDASKDALTLSVNSGGALTGLRAPGHVLNNGADFASGVADLLAAPLLLTYTGASGSVTFTVADGVDPSITASFTLTVNPGDADHFTVSFATPQTVNAAFTGSNTVTAKDISNNTVTGFNSDTVITVQQNPSGHDLSGLGGGGGDTVTAASGLWSGGVASMTTLTFVGPTGTYNIVATSAPVSGTSAAVVINAGAFHHMHLAVATPQQVGVAFSGVNAVTLHDIGHNLFTGSAPTITLSVPDLAASAYTLAVGAGRQNLLDQGSDFSSGVADLGSKMIFVGPASVPNPGTYTVQAANGQATPGLVQVGSIVMNAGPLARFDLSMGSSTVYNGEPFGKTVNAVPTSQLTIYARDQYGNTITNYPAAINLPVNLATSSTNYRLTGSATAPGDIIGAAYFTNGVAVIGAQSDGTPLANAVKYVGKIGTWNLTATESVSGKSGQVTIQVQTGPLKKLGVSFPTPQKNAAAWTSSPAVTLLDEGDNPIANFNAASNNISVTTNSPSGNGAISGWGSGNNNVLNRSSDFNAASGVALVGSGTSNPLKYSGVTGTHSFTVSDAAALAAAVSVTVVIQPGDVHHFHLGFASPQSDGVAFTGLNAITAHDESENLKTDFDASQNSVTVAFSSGTYSLTGLGSGNNGVLNRSTDFLGGVATLGANSPNALAYFGLTGSFTVSAQSATGVTGVAWGAFSPVVISLGAFDRLGLQFTSPQRNTVAFTGTNLIIAQDVGGNPIPSFGLNVTLANNKSATLTLSGMAGTGNVLLPADFSNGRADLAGRLVYTGIVGTVTITAIAGDGKLGTVTITINSGDLDHFDLTLGPYQAHNEAFTGTNLLVARDAANQAITSFSAVLNPVTLTFLNLDYFGSEGTLSGLSGGAELTAATDFSGGMATLTAKLTYRGTPGRLIFTARSADNKTGTSGTVNLYRYPLVTTLSTLEGFVHAGATLDLVGEGFFGVTLIALDDPDATAVSQNWTVVSHSLITGLRIPAGLSSGRYNVLPKNLLGQSTASLTQLDILISKDDPETRTVKSSDNVRVVVPPATFTEHTTVRITPEFTAALSLIIAEANAKVTPATQLTLLPQLDATIKDLTLTRGTFATGKTVTLQFPYSGVLDARLEQNLKVIRLNETLRLWEVVSGAHTVDTSAKTVSVALSGFSLYRLAAQLLTAATLGDLAVFPNPVNFGTAVRGTLKFMNLTQDPTIKIYTVAGELVRTLAPQASSGATVNDGTTGRAEWDGTNEQGQAVARGLYLFIVTDSAGHRASGKFVVVK